MQLGIIAKPTEEDFQRTKERGLDFLELCINEGDDVEEFYRNRQNVRKWKNTYGIEVGSIGRWKSIARSSTTSQNATISHVSLNSDNAGKCF